MIINKLEMYNFRQYIGHQSVDFSTDPERNVTVLIGVNTSGKTTIVRAFEWCLYGKNGFEDPILLNSDVKDNMHKGDRQDTWVSVTFTFDNKVYTIKRQYAYICSAREQSDGKVVVSLNKKPEETISLNYLQQDGQTKSPINQANIAETMDRVLPRDLSDYFFFGGERISTIANRTDLTNAVKGLLRLDVLENAKAHLSKVLRHFQANIDTAGDKKAQEAQDSLETYKQRLSIAEKDRDNYKAQMDYWLEKENEYNAQLAASNVDQVKKAKRERDNLVKTLESEEIRLQNAKRALVTAFNTRPYAFFGMPAIKKSLELLECVKDTTESIPGMDQDAIDYLLARGRCICGTKLDPGSIPLEKVMEERRKLPPEHIGAVVLNYKNKSDGYLAGSESFYQTIEQRYKDIRTIQRRIGELRDDLDKQSDVIFDDSEAKKIEAKRKDAHTHYLEAQNDYAQAVSVIGSCRSNIKNCQDVISNFAKTSKKNQKLYAYITYSTEILQWLTETYDSKESVVRAELQKRVNDNFARMYHGERSIRIDEKYRVTYSDVKTDESDGLKAVKSFAFIASLVSMAKDKILDDSNMKLGQEYPLVMDAPFSNVDEIHINNICKILPKTASQVVMAVMEKDWSYAATNLTKYVGASYGILKDRDAEGKEIETSTHLVPMEV